jgi:16S rRNA (cytosine1402-N4)-methyltransferase
MHYSVMAAESLELLAIRPDGVYIDATTGLGGHTALIAQRLTSGLVIANDRDQLSLAMARENTREWAGRIRFHHGAFQDLAEAVAQAGFEKADGLLADLGVSRYQLTAAERGFSFLSDGPLDMRMDQTTGTTAADLVNHTSERAVHRTGRLHPATQTFMALRMAVNDEPGELDRLLRFGPEILNGGGRMVVLSFMSIDDRKVKERFKELGREGRAEILTKHPLQPGDEETARNPASRSAKLRALEMR